MPWSANGEFLHGANGNTHCALDLMGLESLECVVESALDAMGHRLPMRDVVCWCTIPRSDVQIPSTKEFGTATSTNGDTQKRSRSTGGGT